MKLLRRDADISFQETAPTEFSGDSVAKNGKLFVATTASRAMHLWCAEAYMPTGRAHATGVVQAYCAAGQSGPFAVDRAVPSGPGAGSERGTERRRGRRKRRTDSGYVRRFISR